jgi:hydrogenase nickel incorporation protein HypA/HybF
MGIVEIAEEQVKQNRAAGVDAIELEIGELAGIQSEAFDFAWPSAVKGTVLQRAQKQIHRLPGRARCTDCLHDFALQALFQGCPACGSFLYHILQGREMRVKSITLSINESG